MQHRKLTQEELIIYRNIKAEVIKTNRLYDKVKKQLGITKIQPSRGYHKYTCYRYKYLFKVYLTQKDICYSDYWQFDFAQTMYDEKLRLYNFLYASYRNQKIEVIDQEGNIYQTTPEQLIQHDKHRDVHKLKWVRKVPHHVA